MENLIPPLGYRRRYPALEIIMSLQFLSLERDVLERGNTTQSLLVGEQQAKFEVPQESMVAFSVIETAANDPSSLLRLELRAIDQLKSGGNKLKMIGKGSDTYHLPHEMLNDAMIDFTRLTQDAFSVLAMRYSFSLNIEGESADALLREFATSETTVNQNCVNENKSTDWLNEYKWATLDGLREFIMHSLKTKREIVRIATAG